MWVFRWLISKTLRKAVDSYKQVNKLLQEQRDILMPAEQEEVVETLAQLREAIKTPMPREELQGIVDCELEKAGKVLKPHPDSWMRETVEMFLVVFVSVIAFRAFFLQPFKIPTGSMQPTLHGITHVNLLGDRARPVPGRVGRVGDWFKGVTWYHLKAEGKWKLIDITAPSPASLTKPWGSQKFIFETIPEGKRVTRKIWYSYLDNPPYKNEQNPYGGGLIQRALARMPDRRERDFEEGPMQAQYENARSMVAANWHDLDGDGIDESLVYMPGEDIFKFCVKTGDHLFVDRMVYNFRKPQRGEIIVFETKGIDYMQRQGTDNQFYIKRLVGFDGESLCIGGPDLPPKQLTILNTGNSTVQINTDFNILESQSGLTFDKREVSGYRVDLALGDIQTIESGEEAEISLAPIIDNHIRINGRALSSSDKNFEHIYGFSKNVELHKIDNLDDNSTSAYGKVFPNYTYINSPVFAGRSSALNPSYIGHLGYPENRLQKFTASDWSEVPGKGYWAMGDNTSSSSDSRMWGEVPEQNLIGTPFFIYWPLLQDPDRVHGSLAFGWQSWISAILSLTALFSSIWWMFRLPTPRLTPAHYL